MTVKQEQKAEEPNVYTEVVLRSQTGASLIMDGIRPTPRNLYLFQAYPDHPPQLSEELKKAGFTVIASSRLGVSIMGPQKLHEEFFKTSIAQRPVRMPYGRRLWQEASSFFLAETPRIPSDIVHLAETMYIPRRGYYLAGEGAMPVPGYYHLRPPADISRLTNADAAHRRGYDGTGVRVGMVDSGFIADHDYYAPRGYSITVHAAMGAADQDEYGHGTGIASNLLAVAPGCDFHFYKMDDTANWAALAAFRLAVQDRCQVITNSWGVPIDPVLGPVLEGEIVDAIRERITVVFACGNICGGDDYCELAWPGVMREVISVGGAYPLEGGGWEAASYAASADADWIRRQRRPVPDLCGTVGHCPRGILIVMPTMMDSVLDNWFSPNVNNIFPDGDETAADDGWLVASGTSSAAPQVAGAAALMLQADWGLTPAAIKQILMNTCIDVVEGQSGCGEAAAVGTDLATGAGMLDVDAAVVAAESGRPCAVAPIDRRERVCPVAPFWEQPPAPIVPCAVAPFQCRVAPFIECLKAPFIECRVAPVLGMCRTGPFEGCLAGPWMEPDPREVIIDPVRLRVLQEGQLRRLVPVTVMVDEVELETWKAVERAYAEGRIGLRGEFRNFPPVEGRQKGPFNPRGEG